MDQAQYKLSSPIGQLYLVASPKGLRSVGWKKQAVPLKKSLNRFSSQEEILDKARIQLTEYFGGKRRQFEIPFDLEGTSFQKQVWKGLFEIPFGKTVSYKDIAKRIKNPKAVRAVGSANGKNPVCVMIPCHRVIAADGSIGGYSGGLSIKQKLLKLEGIIKSIS